MSELPIGKTILAMRVQRGMTQEVLAGLADVSVGWLSRVERGNRGMGIRVDDLVRIAEALGVEATDLIKRDVGTVVNRPPPAGLRGGNLRRLAATRSKIERLSTRWGTVVGRVYFPWVVASFGPYRAEHIESYYSPAEPTYPADIEESFRGLHVDIERRAAMGDEVPYDSDAFKLTRFHVSSRTRGLEEPKLVLHFAPTTYYRMLVTDQRLDVPLTWAGRTYTLRELYAAEIDLRV
ncbi:MAG: helix-turn-helix domain-containing protein, partial [Candidatus Dormibacteraeota bacterium]|nr:helix-turn-helix domain-containing protein [Candidatus Dormibacteraeota bacterium]